MIFSDPPIIYNSKTAIRPDSSVTAVIDDWDKFSSFEEHDLFTQKWLVECKRLLKPNGSIWAMEVIIIFSSWGKNARFRVLDIK